MANDMVLVTKSGGITRLTLNRPEKLNALNRPLYEAMMAALEAAEKDDGCRVLVLTGAGRAFCAGQELGAGAGFADQPRQEVGAAAIGHQADPGEGLQEDRRFPGYDDIARQRQARAAAGRDTVDRGDDRLGQSPHALDHLVVALDDDANVGLRA